SDQLTEAEKKNITFLSQLAGGLASGLVGDSTQAVASGADIAKRAVENNTFGLLEHPSTAAEIQKQMFEKMSAEEKQEYYKNIEKLDSIVDNLTDFLPVYGDVKSFQEAEEALDYAIVLAGIIPGSELITKPLKEAKVAYQLATKANNQADLGKYINTAQVAINQSRSEYTKPLGSKYNQMNQPKNPSYQPVRNSATTINGRDYSGHALDRMQDRGIMPSVIENTIKNGVKSESYGNTSIYVDSVNGVKVVVNTEGKVITVTYGK
ncbi:VENN motif pre-toxin domain-containing protein, partial [Ursidibacter arcticus]